MVHQRRGRQVTGFLKDFQDFIQRGNVVDLAVAVIIGGAFGKVVDAFVNWLLSVLLKPALKAAGVDQLKNLPFSLGDLAVAVVNFIIIAFVVYLIIRALEKFLRREEATAPPSPELEAQAKLTSALERLTDKIESLNR